MVYDEKMVETIQAKSGDCVEGHQRDDGIEAIIIEMVLILSLFASEKNLAD
jgi:hypothetical protein